MVKGPNNLSFRGYGGLSMCRSCRIVSGSSATDLFCVSPRFAPGREFSKPAT